MSFSIIILMLFVINYSVSAQEWTITTTNTGFPDNNDVAVRIYGNYAAFLGKSLRFCYFENLNVQNCITSVDTTVNAGDFYDDGNNVYFIALCYFDLKIHVYQLSLTEVNPQASLKQSVSLTNDAPTSISIDYYHRWMAVGGQESLFIFDILNPTSISLKSASKSSSFYLSKGLFALSGTSLYKNRVCTCADGNFNPAGLICYTISKGILSPFNQLQPSFRFTSVRVYEYFIVTGMESTNNIWIFDSSLSLLGQRVATTTPSNIFVTDFFRSENIIVSGNSSNSFEVYNISNPNNPALLASSYVTNSPLSFFPTPDALFATLGIDYETSVHVKVDINFPPGQNWSSFYANSEWNGYGRVKNTLTYRASIYTLVYGQSDTILLNPDITDTYLPSDVSISYTVVAVPFDFTLERFQSTWFGLTSGRRFQHSDIMNQTIRIRYLNKENPLTRNLSQTIEVMANNGRGSRLQFSISVKRIYQTSNCVPFGLCNDSHLFSCNIGAQISRDGRQCVPCPENTYKSAVGIQGCTQCPANSNCTTGSTSIQCQVGFSFLQESSSCVSLSNNSWFIMNPVLGFVLIVCGAFGVFLCAFILGFSVKNTSSNVMTQCSIETELSQTTNDSLNSTPSEIRASFVSIRLSS